MTVITIVIQYPEREAQGIKEALAMDCEKYGRGVRVAEVREIREEQVRLEGFYGQV